MTRYLVLSMLLASAASWLGPHPARAQPRAPVNAPAEADLSQARAIYVAGTAAAEATRWGDAARHFTSAYELSGVPVALFNLGYALRALGRYVEARDVTQALLERHRSALEGPMVAQADQLLAEASARVAVLVLDAMTDAPHQVRLDGTVVVDEGQRPFALDLDPGVHTVSVERAGHVPFRWEGRVDDSDRRALSVVLEPIVPAVQEGEPPLRDESSVFESPWFWTAIGVVLVGGAVAGGVLLAEDPLQPQSDRRYSL